MRELKKDYFNAKRENDNESMEYFNEEVDEQKIVCEEAQKAFEEAAHKLEKARKHTLSLDLAEPSIRIENRSNNSLSKKKNPRTMTVPTEDESMAIMSDTSHSFTSTLSPRIIRDLENEKTSMQSTIDLLTGNSGDSESDSSYHGEMFNN